MAGDFYIWLWYYGQIINGITHVTSHDGMDGEGFLFLHVH